MNPRTRRLRRLRRSYRMQVERLQWYRRAPRTVVDRDAIITQWYFKR